MNVVSTVLIDEDEEKCGIYLVNTNFTSESHADDLLFCPQRLFRCVLCRRFSFSNKIHIVFLCADHFAMQFSSFSKLFRSTLKNTFSSNLIRIDWLLHPLRLRVSAKLIGPLSPPPICTLLNSSISKYNIIKQIHKLLCFYSNWYSICLVCIYFLSCASPEL